MKDAQDLKTVDALDVLAKRERNAKHQRDWKLSQRELGYRQKQVWVHEISFKKGKLAGDICRAEGEGITDRLVKVVQDQDLCVISWVMGFESASKSK
jgi:hypothetical protein